MISPQENIVLKTSRGNTLTIIFKYPEENPERYLTDITNALDYAGVFQDIQLDEEA